MFFYAFLHTADSDPRANSFPVGPFTSGEEAHAWVVANITELEAEIGSVPQPISGPFVGSPIGRSN